MRRIVSVYFALVLALIAFVVFVAGTLAPDFLADVQPSPQVKKTAPAPLRMCGGMTTPLLSPETYRLQQDPAHLRHEGGCPWPTYYACCDRKSQGYLTRLGKPDKNLTRLNNWDKYFYSIKPEKIQPPHSCLDLRRRLWRTRFKEETEGTYGYKGTKVRSMELPEEPVTST